MRNRSRQTGGFSQRVVAIAVLFLLYPAFSSIGATITIVANPGPFGSVPQAAIAEEQVNFGDNDPADENACTESFAAMELRHFLAACMNLDEATLPFSPVDRLPAQGDVLVLGSRASNPLIDRVDPQPKGAKKFRVPDSFRLHAFFESNRTIVVIEGSTRVGTLYGVYAYLERMGMRFYGLGEQGTVYRVKPAAMVREIDIVEEPKFQTRGFMGGSNRGNRTFFLWMARNRMNFWTVLEDGIPFLKKVGMRLSAGGHHLQSDFLGPQTEYPYDHPRFQGDEAKPPDPYAVSPQYRGDADHNGKLTYAEAHPEWYALHAGKRVGNLSYNYCTSNPDATREYARNLIQSLVDGRDRNADAIDLWMLDHGPWCECEECRRQGSCTDRMLDMQHRVYKEIQSAQRKGRLNRSVQLLALAYLETLPAPTRPLPEDFDYQNCLVTFFPISRCYAHPLADPACTEINLHTLRCYEDWALSAGRFYKGSMFIGEYYNVSSIKTLPVVYTHLLAADIPWYYRSGVRNFHYMHTPTSLWGTWTLNQFLLARLLWNPDTKVDALLEDYFCLYYPTTAERTRRFYQHLETATANIKAFKHHVWTGGDAHYCLPGRLNATSKDLFPLDHLHYESFHPTLNDAPDVVEIMEAMRLARVEIDGALLECRNVTERLRLLEDERRFAYGEAMFGFLYHLVRTMTFHHQGDANMARAEFAAVERMADRLRSIVDLVQVSFRHANAKNGVDASQAEPAYNFLKKRYSATATRTAP